MKLGHLWEQAHTWQSWCYSPGRWDTRRGRNHPCSHTELLHTHCSAVHTHSHLWKRNRGDVANYYCILAWSLVSSPLRHSMMRIIKWAHTSSVNWASILISYKHSPVDLLQWVWIRNPSVSICLVLGFRVMHYVWGSSLQYVMCGLRQHLLSEFL